jgi:hypothetical protein
VGAKLIKPLNWSIVLPLGTIGLGWIGINRKKMTTDNNEIILLAILGLIYILMNLMIDFWPRYLMPLLPMFILILGYLLKNKNILLGLVLIGTLPSLYFLLFPTPNSLIQEFNSKKSEGFYRETYRMLDLKSREKFDEPSWKILENNLTGDQVVTVKENNQWKVQLVNK